jgi:tol-pal system protein YbgF
MRFKSFLVLTTASLILLTSGAMAQGIDNSALMDRINRLERDIYYLQRQNNSSGGSSAASGGGSSAGLDVQSARLGSDLSAMEEDLRKIRGQIEVLENRQDRLDGKMERITEEMDFRFKDIENRQSSPNPLNEPAAINGEKQNMKLDVDDELRKANGSKNPALKPTDSKLGGEGANPSSGDNYLRMNERPLEVKDGVAEFSNSQDHYNYAFKLLNQAKFKDAQASLERFIAKYPGDALIGNAFYWLGEVHYVNRDYLKSADSFRLGFEKLPDGPKAPDNLLKLGMSLSNLNKTQEACVVYKRIISKYKDTSSSVRQNTEREIARLKCS